MKHFKNILVVAESDEATLKRAALLARDNQGKVTLIHVVKEPQSASEFLQIGKRQINLRELVLSDMQQHLTKVAQSLHSYGIQPEVKVCFGEPSHEIISDVLNHQRDLVIMTADVNVGLRERIFGGMSNRMVRKCPVPLLVTRPDRGSDFKIILAAVDPTTSYSSRDDLNSSILQLSSELAERENAELHVVNAWAVIGESVLRGQSDLEKSDVDNYIRQAMDKRQEELRQLLRQQGVAAAKLHVIKGEASAVITKLVDTLKVDLLVMGTVCRTGVPGFIIGNTAERVLSGVQCSLLVVKPEGFVSPVVSGERG